MTTTNSKTNDTDETDTADSRIEQLKQTVRTALNRQSTADDGTPRSNVTVNDKMIEEVATAANVSPAEARAVIEQMDAEETPTDDESDPAAVKDPSLRTYAADLIAPASLRIGPTTRRAICIRRCSTSRATRSMPV